MEKGIAVRFYENKRYGHTHGKGQYHKALYNATADVQHPKVKYLLDLYNYSDWINTAKTADDMQCVGAASDIVGGNEKSNYLLSWLKRLNADGSKPKVDGFGLLNLDTGKLLLLIVDTETGVEENWQLEVKPCKPSAGNRNSPQLLATNIDLS